MFCTHDILSKSQLPDVSIHFGCEMSLTEKVDSFIFYDFSLSFENVIISFSQHWFYDQTNDKICEFNVYKPKTFAENIQSSLYITIYLKISGLHDFYFAVFLTNKMIHFKF